jgi:uncharacterized repeat protein (TIGR02543 family)
MSPKQRIILKRIFTLTVCILALLAVLFMAHFSDPTVVFKDKNLENVVRDVLKNKDRPITKDDLLNITELDASNKGIRNLDGIEYFQNLVTLNLDGNKIEDVSPLKYLKNIRDLNLADNGITDLEKINFKSLTNIPLSVLNLDNNYMIADDSTILKLTDISDVGKLDTLEELYLEKNSILDISSLYKLYNLKVLDLRANQITNIDALRNMAGLKKLNLRENSIRDISVLSKLRELSYLNIHSNPDIISIAPLSDLKKLRTLIMSNVAIAGKEIKLLSDLTDLKKLEMEHCSVSHMSQFASFIKLEELDLRNNSINDISGLSGMNSLKTLDLRYNDIEDIHALKNMNKLKELNLRSNDITDVSPLGSLLSLKELNLRDNNDIEDITPLRNLKELIYLNIHSDFLIKSIEPVSGLTKLQTLIMRSVPVGNQITVLQNLTKLEHLNVRNCGITDATVIGKLMSFGALQDDNKSDIKASVNLLENKLSFNGSDSYALISSSWNNVSYRYPTELVFDGMTAEKPRFSRDGGFYEDDFSLTLTASDPDTVIFYTLDGSEPSPFNTSGSTYYYKNKYPKEPDDDFGKLISREYITLRYTAPIAIGRNTFNNKSIVNINTIISGKTPFIPDNITNGIAVRAIAYKEGCLPSPIVTNTYFIGKDMKERYNVPVVSLVTGEYNLFDYYSGIYVGGEFFDNWRRSNPEKPYIWKIPTNYHQQGPKWEREASIELYSANSQLLVDQMCGIRIHGGSSSPGPDKSLRVYAREDYGQDLFNIKFFGSKDIDEFKSFILRISGNDFGKTLFRDALMQSLLQDLKVDRQGYQPAVLFINGVYWGIHNIREYIDLYYLYFNHGADIDKISLLTGEAVTKKKGSDSHYINMLKYIKNNDIADTSVYEHVNTLMDIDNYLDYFISEIYFGNDDWPKNNIDYWRYKTEEYDPGAPYGLDGRWRWIMFDTDHGFGLNGDYTSNTLEHATGDEGYGSFLFKRLLQNESFRNSYINRSADYLNTIFSPATVIKQIDKMHDYIAPLIPEHINRWGSPSSVEQWEKEVEVLREFARKRPYYLREYISEKFELSGTVNISITGTDFTEGTIIVNSVDIGKYDPDLDSTDVWKGVYFKGVPIKITAVAKPGYVFSGWKNPDSKDASLSLIPNKDLSLTAIFIKEN